ncbi:hypothetical protein GMORB2_2189 [Geosmithia morbida]|uniref:LysM domain-containing protein n=1 Tax=Geosmithia morbida TaxID=1094350 RepID=A0A9P4YRI3_9HYPO|nr:uncharacterized protein GMORB2_2189 [Geosmithia morbida]KAF4121227.1 hypothetical protein GMORB2_2189 [Geosmithia morbida]
MLYLRPDPLDCPAISVGGGTTSKSPCRTTSDDDDEKPGQDTLHFLDHNHDTITSLSLRYGVPAAALRRANKLTSDHLLLARRTILIPHEFYKAGVSLSPRPLGGEDEELRKSKIRRFMTSTKVADYDVAQLYLQNAGYDFPVAVEAYFADETWETRNPSRKPAGDGSKPKKHRGPFWRGL